MELQEACLALASCSLEGGGVVGSLSGEFERSRSAEIKWEEKLRGQGRWRSAVDEDWAVGGRALYS